jgi:hypothetical protein
VVEYGPNLLSAHGAHNLTGTEGEKVLDKPINGCPNQHETNGQQGVKTSPTSTLSHLQHT